MELLVRIANDRYIRNKLTDKIESALEMLLNKHILSHS